MVPKDETPEGSGESPNPNLLFEARDKKKLNQSEKIVSKNKKISRNRAWKIT